MIRPAMLVIMLLVVSLSLTLFAVKYDVQDMESQLVDLNRRITRDRQSIHVLKAEWSHLNEPERLRTLAERYLGMTPIEPEQVGTAAEMLPPLDGVSGAESVSGTVTPLPGPQPVSAREIPQ